MCGSRLTCLGEPSLYAPQGLGVRDVKWVLLSSFFTHFSCCFFSLSVALPILLIILLHVLALKWLKFEIMSQIFRMGRVLRVRLCGLATCTKYTADCRAVRLNFPVTETSCLSFANFFTSVDKNKVNMMNKAASSKRYRLAIGMLILLVLGPFLCTCNLREFGLRRLKERNLVFNTDLLWITPCTSVVWCSVLCSSDPLCVFFTVTKKAPSEVQCRGHSAVVNLADGQSSQGSSLYVLGTGVRAAEGSTPPADGITSTTPKSSWLNIPCTSRTDCPESLGADCHYKTKECLCKPGKFYSVTNDMCQQGCLDSDLEDGFLGYEGIDFDYDHLDWMNSVTLPDCLELCVAYQNEGSYCQALSYEIFEERCGLAVIPNFNANNYEWYRDLELNYYQRMCL